MAEEKSQRLLSLDVFRGITIMGMILVNNPGTWDAIYPQLEHAKWHGCTFTDLIFPFFLFIVGVAISYSLTKRKNQGGDMKSLYLNILRRTVILFGLGLILAGFPFGLLFGHEFSWSTIRIPGVLQRIAIVYMISAFLFLTTNTKFQYWFTGIILVLYAALMSFIPVPGVGYANFEPGTNLSAWLDRLILGNHLWSGTKLWDPEGILSTMPAIGNAMLGIFTGNLLRSDKDSATKTVWMYIAGSVFMLAGWVWSFWFPLNKNIWTSSYVLWTVGLALNFLAFCYWFIDVKKVTWWIKPFHVYGMNAITVFFLSGIVGRIMYMVKWTGDDGNIVTIKSYLFDNFFLSWLEPINASLAWAIVYILVWLGLMWILYAKKIFIKV
ncbi:MAG: lpg1661 family Dot/Icm T4SS effector [Ignavibacteriales bacterium]